MSSLWASVSPLNQEWSQSPFTIRITYEGLVDDAPTGIRLIIVGDYPLDDEIIVQSSRSHSSITHQDALGSHSEIPAGVYTLAFQLDFIQRAGSWEEYQRLELTPAEILISKKPRILFDRTYSFDSSAPGRGPLEIPLSRLHFRRWTRRTEYRGPHILRTLQSIHIQILHSLRTNKATRLIQNLPAPVVSTIARHLLSSRISEHRFFPTYLLSMALTQKSWLHVLDQSTLFLNQGINFPNRRLIADLLATNSHWQERVKHLHWRTFISTYGNSSTNLDRGLERGAFFRSIKCLSASLEGLTIDFGSLYLLSESEELRRGGESNELTWPTVRVLKVERTDYEDSIKIETLTHALRLFPGLMHLDVPGIDFRNKESLQSKYLNAPLFNLQTLNISSGSIDCQRFQFLIPLNQPPAEGLQLTTLSFDKCSLYYPEKLADLFRLVSSTLRDLTVTRTGILSGHEGTLESMRALFSDLPMKMEKLRRMVITAKYVTPAIIQNMSRLPLSNDSGKERTHLEIAEFLTSPCRLWEGEEDGDPGQKLLKSIDVTEWDEITFSGFKNNFTRAECLEELIGERARSRGYRIVRTSDTLEMKRE